MNYTLVKREAGNFSLKNSGNRRVVNRGVCKVVPSRHHHHLCENQPCMLTLLSTILFFQTAIPTTTTTTTAERHDLTRVTLIWTKKFWISTLNYVCDLHYEDFKLGTLGGIIHEILTSMYLCKWILMMELFVIKMICFTLYLFAAGPNLGCCYVFEKNWCSTNLFYRFKNFLFIMSNFNILKKQSP